jgi:energy-coupling factor transporter ATP-binding protein EcfA2
VFQDFALVKEMNVCENLFLGNEIAARGIIRWQEAFSRARDVLREVGLDIDPLVEIFRLGVIQQLLIGIAKALVKSARFLILDEPTTLLSATDTENLYTVIRRLKNKGLSCIYTSKKLHEVFEIADRVTVLRDGRTVVTKELTEVSQTEVRDWMNGPQAKAVVPLGPGWPEPVLRGSRRVATRSQPGSDSDVGALVEHFRKKQGYLKRMAIRNGHAYRVFEIAAVDFFRAENSLVFMHVDGSRHLIDLPLARLEAKLDPAGFYRVHRSTIVNLSKIRQILPWGRGMFKLEFGGGERVSLSRHRLQSFRKLMGLD